MWQKTYGAVCNINCFNNNKIKVCSFTGFKINNYLITDATIYTLQNVSEIELRFVSLDGYSTVVSKQISFKEFESRILDGTKDRKSGYAIINIDFSEFSDIPSLNLCSNNKKIEIGTPIFILGYQIDQSNLSIHAGYISSYYLNDNGNKYIQFDASIKPGYSGGPLINAENGDVIGIIGYRLVRSIMAYNSIKDIADSNIRMLEEAIDNLVIKNIDPIQVLIAQENQIKMLAKELYKTSYRSVGFAIEICKVMSEFELHQAELSAKYK